MYFAQPSCWIFEWCKQNFNKKEKKICLEGEPLCYAALFYLSAYTAYCLVPTT